MRCSKMRLNELKSYGYRENYGLYMPVTYFSNASRSADLQVLIFAYNSIVIKIVCDTLRSVASTNKYENSVNFLLKELDM